MPMTLTDMTSAAEIAMSSPALSSEQSAFMDNAVFVAGRKIRSMIESTAVAS